jgi:hypothetical protein
MNKLILKNLLINLSICISIKKVAFSILENLEYFNINIGFLLYLILLKCQLMYESHSKEFNSLKNILSRFKIQPTLQIRLFSDCVICDYIKDFGYGNYCSDYCSFFNDSINKYFKLSDF